MMENRVKDPTQVTLFATTDFLPGCAVLNAAGNGDPRLLWLKKRH